MLAEATSSVPGTNTAPRTASVCPSSRCSSLPWTASQITTLRSPPSVTARVPSGEKIGVKPAGGIRTAKDAIKYLVMVNETTGPDWLTPEWFRFGASTLLNDMLMQRTKLATGRYSGPDYFTLD